MKKSFISAFSLAAFVAFHLNVNAQLGGLMNKVKAKMVNSAMGNTESGKDLKATQVKEDPLCACKDATVAFKFTDNLKINYKESTFSVSEDGTLLVFDKFNKKYYTSKDGILSGPYETNDPIVSQFETPDEDTKITIEVLMARYKGIIVPSGEKYAIKMGGKTYGPYAVIQSFVLNRSKNKFAAIVTADVVMTEDQGSKMEQAMKNSKSDQERMELAMKMSQQMQERMMAGGGTMDVAPKLVSNIPGAKSDMIMGNNLSGTVKFDDIVGIGYDKISDLTGKTLITFDPQKIYASKNEFWLNSDNSKVASYNYGRLTISDGTEFTEVFCPYVMKADDKIYLTYMYFSPANNAIMQCRLLF
jgi:hypothetical protein